MYHWTRQLKFAWLVHKTFYVYKKSPLNHIQENPKHIGFFPKMFQVRDLDLAFILAGKNLPDADSLQIHWKLHFLVVIVLIQLSMNLS